MTAFVNVTVIPMDRERVLPGQTVLVQGDRIIALGPAGRVAVPAGATRIAGRGRFLLPGLADMHVHLGYQNTGKENIADILLALVANGVTTVRDMHSGGPQSWQLALRRRVVAGELLGPRIYTAGDPDVSSPAAAAQSAVALKAAGHDFAKVNGSELVYDSLVVAARRVGLPLGGHGLTGALRDRWASIEHLDGYVEKTFECAAPEPRPDPVAARTPGPRPPEPPECASWSWATDSTGRLNPARLRALAHATRQAGVWGCPTLAVWERTLPQALDRVLQVVKALHDAGAGLLLGTDMHSGAVFPGFAIHRELELLVEAGLTPYQALATGTRNVAAFLGTLDSTGTLAVGKRADLVLLRGNPLRNIRHTAALAGVMVGGQWLPRAELERRLEAAQPVVWWSSGDEADSVPYNVQLRMARRWLWR